MITNNPKHSSKHRLTMVSVNGAAVFVPLPSDMTGKVRIGVEHRDQLIVYLCEVLEIPQGACVRIG